MTNAPPPLVSVVMPVYNRKEYTALALESILRQTFSDFEFLIVDDGSVDGSADVIAHYQTLDSRIQVYRHEQNRGLVEALNTGCTHAQGRYIAIMHSDDISLLQRLEQQVAYLETHPSIALLGTGIQYINSEGVPFGEEIYPSMPGFARWNLFFYNSLAHPTVMMRRALIEPLGFYQHGAPGVEDFDLWIRATREHDLASLPVVLLQYRQWDNNITAHHHTGMMHASVEINHQAAVGLLGHEVSTELIANLWFLLDRARTMPVAELHQTGALIAELYRAYISHYKLTVPDARLVAEGAANKLFYLAVRALRKSPIVALRLLWAGLRIDPLAFISTASRLLRKPTAYLQPASKI
jgi:glycosyltransferase involved in cell wall biosynthesis